MAGSAGYAELARINTLLAQVDTKVIEFQNKINSIKVPTALGWIWDRIVEGWNWFIKQLERLYNLLKHILENMGAPWKLWDTATAWSDNVGDPVSKKAHLGKAGSLAVDDNWDGDAADQYRQILTQHEAPFDKMRATYADGISIALSAAATGIIKFWVALAVALAALIGGIITAIASTATIFGAPAGPFIAAGAVIICVAAVTGGVLLLKSDLRTADTTLRQKISDNTGYPEGNWPKFVVR